MLPFSKRWIVLNTVCVCVFRSGDQKHQVDGPELMASVTPGIKRAFFNEFNHTFHPRSEHRSPVNSRCEQGDCRWRRASTLW